MIVLEASDRIGGRVKSEPRDPYWLNFGAHVFGGPGTATGRLLAETLVEAAGVPGTLTAIALNDRIVAGGRVETYPMRLPLTLRERLALIRVGVRLRLAVARYDRISRAREGETDAERTLRTLAYLGDRSFAEWLGPVPPDVDAILRPTIARSSGEPEDVAAGYGVGYFHLVWSRGRGLSFNVIGGSGRLTDAIAHELEGRIWARSRVEEVTSEDEGVRIRYIHDRERSELRARYAVVATPAYVTRAIVRGLPEETDRALAAISYGPYVVAGLLTAETSAMPWDAIYALATPKRSFNMLFNTANVLRPRSAQRQPGGSLMIYSGGSLGTRLLELDDERIVSIYTNDLYDLFPESRGMVREIVVQRWLHGLPYPRPGRHLLQPALERSLGRVYLAGDYLGTWYTETAIRTGMAAAGDIAGRLTGPGSNVHDR